MDACRRHRSSRFLLVAALVLCSQLAPVWLLPRRRSALSLRAQAPSPEAWREFRAQLISGGLKLTTDDDSTNTVVNTSAAERKVVAPRNEKLLKDQNEELWNEYINGAWAHAAPVEVGGILCRLPLAVQLLRSMRDRSKACGIWGQRLREALEVELPEDTENRSKEELFESWSQNTAYCYRLAESLMNKALSELSEKVNGGVIDPQDLDESQLQLFSLYGREQETWQSVCLVLSSSESAGTEAVTLNRPLARSIDERLGNLLLTGQQDMPSGAVAQEIERLVSAFGQEAAVYLGGPDRQLEPGILIHGLADLPGAEEISPGTRIFRGGVEAAIDGILEGRCSPLDFRWFVGRHRQLNTKRGEWQAVACARPVALKQCLGLPKPLWHEVMELCGGEYAEISNLEMTKRSDLEQDE